MLVLAWCVIALASPLIVGRWPAGLFLNRWRMPWLIWLVLLAQALALTLELPHAVAATLHVGTYVAAVAFLWLNRRFPGVYFVGAGALTNGVVIAINGGTLPASAAAVARAGLTDSGDFQNSAVLENPVLPWLGDVFAWPAPWPLANTFSVGDVLIVIGAFVAAWSGARRFGQDEPEPVEEAAGS